MRLYTIIVSLCFSILWQRRYS
uniref:Uncharacterized protein n=1 Tax=Zea mays TaxID=4577 RepID=B7ZZE2_MAIZE|nr:unknown [Zea mays]